MAAAVACALGATTVRAAEVTWTGANPAVNDTPTGAVYPAGTAYWDATTANWSGAPTYTAGDDVVFTDNFTGPNIIGVSSAAQSPASVTFRHIAGTTPTNYVFLRASTSASPAYNTAAGFTYSSVTPFAAGSNTTLTLDSGFLGLVAIESRATSGDGGNTIIRSGTLEIRDANALPGSNVSAPTITLDGGSFAVNVSTNNNTQPASSNLVGPLTVLSDSTLRLNAANTSRLYNGSITMSPGTTLNVVSTNGFRADLAGTQTSTLGGRVLLGASTPLRLNAAASSSANAIWDLGTSAGTLLTNNAGTYNLGELRGSVTTRLEGSTGTAAATFAIGGLNTSSTFDGVIANGSGGGTTSLTKAGTGALTLTNTNTYTGATNVQNGTLRVNGSLAAGSAVSVGNTTTPGLSPTLGGTGTVNGVVTVLGDSGGAGSAGHLAPGAGVGTLHVGGLTLQPGSIGDFEFGALANDLVVVNNTDGLVINGGGINLFTEGTTSPFAGDGTFHLMQFSGLLGGSEDNLAVLNPQSGFTYDFVVSAGPAGTSYVDLVVAVPEPTSIALMGLGGMALLRRRRHQPV